MNFKIFFTILLVLASTDIFAASFDCSKASKSIDKMVCADDQLSKLDDELNTVYKHALLVGASKEEIKQQQLMWLKNIRYTCKDAECLKVKYNERILALKNPVVDAVSASHSNDKRTSEDKPILITRDVSGTYVRETENESAELEIRLLQSGKVRVTGISFYGTKQEYGPNTGELDFVSTINNGHILHSEKKGKDLFYKLELIFKKKGLIVKEEGLSKNFGLNVTFAGDYRTSDHRNRSKR